MASYLEGRPVLNAEKPQVIYITAEDVSLGKSKEPDCCVAAIACMRNPGVQKARVHLSTTYLKIKNKWYRYKTPASLRDEIVAFDRGGQFFPGEFKLNPVPPSMAKHRRSGSRVSVTNAPKRINHMVMGVREHASATLEKSVDIKQPSPEKKKAALLKAPKEKSVAAAVKKTVTPWISRKHAEAIAALAAKHAKHK